ncbi:CheY-like chemotaxis protein [Paraburkholderia sp. JPY162]|uniref:CheY-like chemotaxis protein n=1 Tax=Paraburkholderia youngii TaxID=2782701 RepID=A0A7W8L511_9BURK|nr:CheY-like chemotaxis protein [Paraburkholderia youngii]
MIRHILAVDDSASMRQILAATLTGAGYEVTLAADGNEGLENALAMAFDLVLTDQHMPGKTGLDLITALRGNPAYQATPILVLTTESGEPFKEAARSGRDRLDRKAARPGHADRAGGGAGRTGPGLIRAINTFRHSTDSSRRASPATHARQALSR